MRLTQSLWIRTYKFYYFDSFSTLAKSLSQTLKRYQAVEINQDKNAIGVENWYLSHNFAGQCDLPASCRRSVTQSI